MPISTAVVTIGIISTGEKNAGFNSGSIGISTDLNSIVFLISGLVIVIGVKDSSPLLRKTILLISNDFLGSSICSGSEVFSTSVPGI